MPKVECGLYSNWIMYFPDQTGWYVGLDPKGNSNFSVRTGWPTTGSEYEGAALVAPLSILYWENSND